MATPTVHTYTAADTGLFVNSYLLETDEGVVAVDTNLLVADIAAFRARLDALHKPLLGVLITHAHPDHFNGAEALTAGTDALVYAPAGVARGIADVAQAKREQWTPVYGDQWPQQTRYPDIELAEGQVLELGGLSITAHDLGAGESHADGYYLVRGDAGEAPVAFIGDVAFHGTHPYTADGHTGAWLDLLDRLENDLAGSRRLLPGHGAPTGLDVLADQRRYLLHYRELVRNLADGQPRLSDTGRIALERGMSRYLPGAPLRWMIGLGADAVAAELHHEQAPELT